MNLAWYDWSIVLFILLLITVSVLMSRGHMKSVADFLAAGRSGGRYLQTVSAGAAGLGAITVVNILEMNYQAGFTQTWWGFTMGLVVLALTVSGWVNYRFRQTRALTLPQFFEMRYSRPFRVFAGGVAYISGLINFGIFPSVGARFFIHFCGLPQHFDWLGLHWSTYPVLMALLLATAVIFVFLGGQVSVMVSDFFQGMFIAVVFVVLILYVMTHVSWTHITEAMAMAPADASKINPFHTSHLEDFNFWYFLIGVFGVVYSAMSWQGTAAYNSSARNAHEAKMGGVLGTWRGSGQAVALLLLPIVAYTVMHHPAYDGIRAGVEGTLAGLDTETVRNQMRVPLVLSQLLPHGLLGAFAALMVAAQISTDETYLHSWGSMLVQDVILPLRGRPLGQRQHLRALRLSILFVALFIFCFSLWFPPNYEYIAMFFAITGAIFAGGSGAVIIGGLYWKRGTTAAAWASMLTGSGIAVGGIIVTQLRPDFFLNGQQFWALSMAASATVYVLVSLAGRRETDLDRLLHRGRWEDGETRVVTERPGLWWRLFGMGKEFTRRDKVLYLTTYAWTFLWGAIFGVGTIWHLWKGSTDAGWMVFWRAYIWLYLVVAVVVLVVFAVGGARDLRAMFAQLRGQERRTEDDGFVRAAESDASRP
jgi:SSS family solute:Na+ symporter